MQKSEKTILDAAPRVILDQDFGLCAVGKNMNEIGIIADLYEHTIECILRAEKLGGWVALPASDIFDLEYWDLEQAKLQKKRHFSRISRRSGINHWCRVRYW